MGNDIIDYLEQLRIPVSKKYVQKFLLSHADYPSLLCVSDLLENLGLDFEIKRLEICDLREFHSPFLLLSEHGRMGFNLVQCQKDLEKLKVRNEFGSAVLIEVKPTLDILNEQHRKSYLRQVSLKWIVIMVVSFLVTLMITSLILSFSWFGLIWMVISGFGLVASYLIYSKDLGFKYSAVEKFCNFGKNSNCDKVLESDNSKVLGFIKFSDLIVSFFIFQIVVFYISGFSNELSNIIWLLFQVLGAVSLPVIIYSIYIQYIVLKSWCKLCLLVSLILILQFAIISVKFYSSFPNLSLVDLLGITTMTFLYPIILGIAHFVRATVEETNESNQSMFRASRIKNSPEVFKHLLRQQRRVDFTRFDQDIVIGNRNAKVQIIFVSNFYCHPCKVEHVEASLLVRLYPRHVAVTFRFVKVRKNFSDHISSAQYIFQYWLENIFGRENESNLTDMMLHKWYAEMDILKFSEYFPVIGEISEDVYKLETLQESWIGEADVLRTPTIFINGYELPSLYSLADLQTLIPDLEELNFSKVIDISKV
jgi:uncharacterized membrane protein